MKKGVPSFCLDNRGKKIKSFSSTARPLNATDTPHFVAFWSIQIIRSGFEPQSKAEKGERGIRGWDIWPVLSWGVRVPNRMRHTQATRRDSLALLRLCFKLPQLLKSGATILLEYQRICYKWGFLGTVNNSRWCCVWCCSEKRSLITLLSCLEDKALSSFDSMWCFRDPDLSSKNQRCRKRKASHISDICLPGKHKQEHKPCFPGAGQSDLKVTQLQRKLSFRCQAYKLSDPESSALMKTCSFRMKGWAVRISALGNMTMNLNALPESHKKLGHLPCSQCSAPVPVIRPPSGQWGYWEDNGNSKEKSVRDTGLWAILWIFTGKDLVPKLPRLQVPPRWGWSLDTATATRKGCGRQWGVLGQMMCK